jgi:hypothetical protein
MIKVYAYLVTAGRKEIEQLPEDYKIPVAEYLASKV